MYITSFLVDPLAIDHTHCLSEHVPLPHHEMSTQRRFAPVRVARRRQRGFRRCIATSFAVEDEEIEMDFNHQPGNSMVILFLTEPSNGWMSG